MCILHKLLLSFELFPGEAKMGVRPAMALEGVDVILGNILARVGGWSDMSPPPVVSNIPFVEQVDIPGIPKVYPACVVCVVYDQDWRQGGRWWFLCQIDAGNAAVCVL